MSRLRTFSALITAAVLVFTLSVIVFAYTRQVKIVNVAEWNSGAREVRLAATMPMCSCLTLSRPSQATMQRLARAGRRLQWSGSDGIDDYGRIAITTRQRGGSAQNVQRLDGNESQWSFAFDWAGAELGDYYTLQAHLLNDKNQVDVNSGPLDMDQVFDISASESRSCEKLTCPFGDLLMNQALGESIGRNKSQTPFTGVRIGRGNRAIEAQAAGRNSGAPGDCGCMLIQVIKAPLKLSATLNGVSRGELTFNTAGAMVRIPFDFAGLLGDNYYVISATAPERIRPAAASGEPSDAAPIPSTGLAQQQSTQYVRELSEQFTERQITEYVRILGQLDGMQCHKSEAQFVASNTRASDVQAFGPTIPTAPSVPSSNTQTGDVQASGPPAPTLDDAIAAAGLGITCPYSIPNIKDKVEGYMDLVAVADRRDPQAPPPTSATTTAPRRSP